MMGMRVQDAIDGIIEKNRDQLVDAVAQFVKIPSVKGKALPGKPFGKRVDDALNFALDLASGMGFNTRNLDGMIGYAEYGDGELVGVLTHVDVVPEGNLDDWEYPPYEGIVHEGILHGRGAVDDKGPLVSTLYGLKALKEADLPVSKKVRVLFGTDEESGWGGIAHYLKHEAAPSCGFSPDGMFTVVNREKGITVVALEKTDASDRLHDVTLSSVTGGTAPNSVPDRAQATIHCRGRAQEAVLEACERFRSKHRDMDFSVESEDSEIVVMVRGQSAHAMAPEQGKNAIADLLRLLTHLPLGDQPMVEFVRLLDSEIGTDYTGKSLGMAWADATSGSLTVNLGTIRIDQSHAEAVLDIRSPVSYTCKQVIDALQSKLGSAGITLSVKTSKEPLHVPADHPLVETLVNVYQEVTGREAVLHAIGGGTYARAVSNCVCFGSVYPDEKITVHRANERVAVESLILNAKIYGRALFELLS